MSAPAAPAAAPAAAPDFAAVPELGVPEGFPILLDHPDTEPSLTNAERAAKHITRDPSSIQFTDMVPPGGAAKGPTIVANHDVRANFKDGKQPMKVKTIATGEFLREWDPVKRKMLVMNVPWQRFRGAHVDVCTDGVPRQINDGAFDADEPKVLAFWLAVCIVPDLGPDGKHKYDDVWGQQCILPLWLLQSDHWDYENPERAKYLFEGCDPDKIWLLRKALAYCRKTATRQSHLKPGLHSATHQAPDAVRAPASEGAPVEPPKRRYQPYNCKSTDPDFHLPVAPLRRERRARGGHLAQQPKEGEAVSDQQVTCLPQPVDLPGEIR